MASAIIDPVFRPQFHSQHTPIRIIQVGAGAAGLLVAYKAQKLLQNFELVCYEKNAGLGGTWYENRFPGCACDVPAHSYTFSFEPNPEWSGYYTYQTEILEYFQNFSKKYGLDKFMRFNTKVVDAKWEDSVGEWVVELETNDGNRFTDRCNVLINGSGALNKWRWPEIEGREIFKGKICHSANWDQSIDWQNKRVAIIGSGATGVQLTPHLAKGSKQLVLFSRSVQWITPPLGVQDVRILDDVNSAAPDAVGKHTYTEDEKKKLRQDSEAFLKYRKIVDGILQRTFSVFMRDSETHDQLITKMIQFIRDRFGPDHQDLAEKFIPSFSPGCRRNTPGEGFIEALVQDHVSFVSDKIVQFNETGLVTSTGKQWDFDIIVCATGFDVAYTPHFPITGRNGISLQKMWAQNPRIYLSVASPDIPNLFHIGGPTGNWGTGSVLASHEVQAEYAIQCCMKISIERLHSVVPKALPTDQYMAHSAAWHAERSVWAEACRSWFKNGGSPEGRVMLWCGSMLHMLKTLRTPRWEDYEIRRRDESDMWAFFGGWGRTQLEIAAEAGANVDIAPFVRNGDHWWTTELQDNMLDA